METITTTKALTTNQNKLENYKWLRLTQNMKSHKLFELISYIKPHGIVKYHCWEFNRGINPT
jgi:hypothetical protein